MFFVCGSSGVQSFILAVVFDLGAGICA